jgi:predicted HTH transcriptional regulator
VERKTNQGKADWLHTAVAFANAVPIGYPAVLFVGVDNKGNPQQNGDLESLQKTVSQEINRAFPPIYYLPRVLTLDGNGFIAIIIPGSPSRPHFAGKAYIRSGPETKEASERQLDLLLAHPCSIRGKCGGATAQVLTKGKSVRVPAESLLTFRLTHPLRR